MYQIVSAVGKTTYSKGRWRAVDVANMLIPEISKSFVNLYITLTNQFLSTPVSLDFNDIRYMAAGLNMTFQEFLAQQGDKPLPTTTNLFKLNTKYVRYSDAMYAGYKVTPVNPKVAVDAELPPADKEWLYLTKNGVDFNKFYKTCLVSVNGFYHYTGSDPSGVYVEDGMLSKTLSNLNTIGITCFNDVGEIEIIKITESMLYKQRADQSFGNRAFINIGKDCSECTIAVVLGGYLHLLDPQTLYRVSDDSVCVEIENIPLIDRFYESKDFVDLSSLPLEKSSRNPDMIAVENLFSDEVIKAYLTLSQSFVVLIKNKNLFCEMTKLRPVPERGLSIAYQKPVYPIVSGHGKLQEYWSTYEDKQWSVRYHDNRNYRYAYYTTLMDSKQPMIVDNLDPEKPWFYGPEYFLIIGSDI